MMSADKIQYVLRLLAMCTIWLAADLKTSCQWTCGCAGMLVTEAALLRGLPSSDLQRDRTGGNKQP
jgi:hypothetical protein